MVRQNFTVDTLLELKDAGAITASAAALVGGSAKIIDLGPGRCYGSLIIDATAVVVDDGDELYELVLEGSNVAAMTSGVKALARLKLGDATVLGNQDTDGGPGRYEVPFSNSVDDTEYRYVRMFHVISGTTPSINYTARIAKKV